MVGQALTISFEHVRRSQRWATLVPILVIVVLSVIAVSQAPLRQLECRLWTGGSSGLRTQRRSNGPKVWMESRKSDEGHLLSEPPAAARAVGVGGSG
jgi:hypothetical protein